MANIRAGVAYVDVRLGSVEKFKNALKDEIEKTGQDAGKKLGDSVKKGLPANAGADLGKQLGRTTSKEFFNMSKTEFAAGFRALATGQFRTASELFKDFGGNLGNSMIGGLRTGFNKFGGFMDSLLSKTTQFATRVGNAAQVGWNKFQEFGKMLDKASQKMGFLSFQIQNFGLIASVAFTAPTVAALTFASVVGIKTAAQIESATNALKYLLPAGINVADVLERLKKIAIESPIFDTTDLILYAQKFTAAGVEISKTERFLRAFSNIALVTGANTDEANRAVVAITQAFGKGKLQSEELNQQLGEAMPSVLKLLREQLGVTQAELTEMVKAGEITGDDLIEIFTKIGESPKFLEGAKDGAKTLNGVFQQLKESLQTQLGDFFLKNSDQIKAALTELGPAVSELITQAGPAFIGLIKGFSSLVKWFSSAVEWYSKLSPGTQDLIRKFILFGTILGPVVLILGTLLGAFAGIAAGIAAIATPVGGTIAAVVAIGAALAGVIVILKNFLSGNSETAQKIREAWNNFYADVITPVVQAFKDLWANIVAAFNQVKGAITSNQGSWNSWIGFLKVAFGVAMAYLKSFLGFVADVLKTVLNVLGPVIRAIGSFIAGAIKTFQGFTDFILGVFTGDWTRAWNGIKQIFEGIWLSTIKVLDYALKAIWNLVSGLVMSVINFFKRLFNELVGHSIIPDMVNAIIAWFNKLTSPIRSVLSFIAGLFRNFGATVTTFVGYFRNGIRVVVDLISGFASKIRSALSNAASWLYNTGRNIVQGLVNGVRSMAGFLKNAILNLIPGPVRSIVSNALGIASPSKVFKEYGRNVIQGFVLGLSGDQKALTNALDMFSAQPRFEGITGSPSDPLMNSTPSSGLNIENYYANDNVDPWRQAEDWYFIVTSRGGVA